MAITGKDLIELGYEPDKWFGEALKKLSGYTRGNISDERIRNICNSLIPKYIKPFDNPKPYKVYLDATTEEETSNKSKVLETMDEVMKTPTVVEGFIMPDACPTGKVGQIPVGGVVVAKNAIHPNMHSADICCSMYMTDFEYEDPTKVLNAGEYSTHFGPVRGGLQSYIGLLRYKMANNSFLCSTKAIELAKTHLGTQGDGNHFLYVGKSKKDGRTKMITHHGSRGLGAYLFKEGMKVAEKFRKTLSPKTNPLNAWIPYNTKEGLQYWEALQIVEEWTKLNHETIHGKTRLAIGKSHVQGRIFTPHNFVFKKGDLFYHAKGSTPLGIGHHLSVIPLSMNQPILIVEPYDPFLGEGGIQFAPHGAGRNISRTQHKRNLEAQGITVGQALNLETKGLDIRFWTGKPDLSELPSAYKNADEVRRQINKYKLAVVKDEIIPYGSIMAGEQDRPWVKK